MSKEDTIKKVKVLAGIASQDNFASAIADLAEAENSSTSDFDAASKDGKVSWRVRG
ncbi:MAG: hypothetical protein JO004_01670 [Methylobacteriaceae bacterium]|nr:hypothetical protein [Methylobacteriaceae bacterium]